MTTPLVELLMSAEATDAGVAVGLSPMYSAAVPQTCGVAMEVPLMVFVAVVDVSQAEVMFTPGAKMSTQVPVLAHVGLWSVLSVALTVMAAGARAGEVVQASTARPVFGSPLPAATQKTTPLLTAPVT